MSVIEKRLRKSQTVKYVVVVNNLIYKYSCKVNIFLKLKRL